ncbi:hypothetical protein [Hydrogenophaga sp. OTU3427]|uniref:hypothetical protein n=1 Tax=Hydrogenophaga sp. OTU3427 TaxID=3043856 RepID=UPI00313CB2C1
MTIFRDDTLLQRALKFAFEACDTRAQEVADLDPGLAEKWLALADKFEVLMGRKIDSLSPKDDELAQEVVHMAEQWLLSRIGKSPHVISDEGKVWSAIMSKFRMRRWPNFNPTVGSASPQGASQRSEDE